MASEKFSGKCVTVHCRTEPIIDTFYYTWVIADFWTVYNNNTAIMAYATDNMPFNLQMIISQEPSAINFYLTDCKVFTESSYRVFLKGDKIAKDDKMKILHLSKQNNVSNYNNFPNLHANIKILNYQDIKSASKDILLHKIEVSKLDDKYLSNQTLTVYFEFYFPKKDLKDTMYMDVLEPCEILSESESKFNSNHNIDSIITIKTNEKCLYISKSLLCSKSIVFNAMFNADVKENATNEVEITDISYNVIKELLSCLCLLQIGILPSLNTDIETICELLIAADKYDIENVKFLCEHRLIMELTSENVVKLLDIACKHNSKILKEYGSKIMKSNITDIMNILEFLTLIAKYPELLNRN